MAITALRDPKTGLKLPESPLAKLAQPLETEEKGSSAAPSAPVNPAGSPSELEGVQVEMAGFSVEQIEASLPTEEVREKYWIGTRENSPFQNVCMGGQTFHRYTEIMQPGVDGREQVGMVRQHGLVVGLTAEEVAYIKEQVARHVIRRLGAQNYILDIKDENPVRKYAKNKNDVPLAHFLYMVKVKDSMPSEWRRFTPPSMLKP